MFVIEGSDYLGKTMLANKLRDLVTAMDHHPVVVSHMSRPNGSFDFFTGYKPFISPYVIQDRFHLSGLAYHDHMITPERLRIIEGWIYGAGGVIVLLCCHDSEGYRQRVKDQPGVITHAEMCLGNDNFCRMVKRTFDVPVTYDACYDIASDGREYLSDEEIGELANMWIARRREAILTWPI